MPIKQSIIDEVLEATDIVQLIGQHVDLKRAGVSWRGLCPFHNEKTPSFFVHPERGFYHCFGCGVGGRSVNFLMAIRGCSFPQAIRELASLAGIAIPVSSQSDLGASEDGEKLKIFEALRLAKEIFVENLWSAAGEEARNYLANRGIDETVAKNYGLGLAFDSWHNLYHRLRRKGFNESILSAAGLIKQSVNSNNRAEAVGPNYYDLFRNRLIIPVLDTETRVVAFAGRILTKPSVHEPKYLNSPASVVYQKGKVLYGLTQARSHIRAGGLAFVVEGYFDLISLVSHGVRPVVAAMGTSLTQSQVNLLRGQSVEVHLVFDSDEAGVQAAKRALPLLFNAEIDGRVIRLPEGHDPDTFVRQEGPEAFFALADQAKDIADYYVERLMATTPSTVTGQSRLISEAKEVLKLVPDGAKAQYLRNQLAEKLGLTPESLGQLSRPSGPPKALSSPTLPPRDYDHLAGLLISHVVAHPECAPLLTDELLPVWPEDRTKPVLSALLTQLKQIGGLKPELLKLEEDPLMSALLASAVLSPRRDNKEQALAVASSIIDKLTLKSRRREQLRYIQAARRAQEIGDEKLLEELVNNHRCF
ncbi:MAG: DNA primase [Deltaproteobacteria bacterium]|jgi:DNA primase|nr:DNA primase [Deltaproteobacteria bacterium]